MRTTPPISTSWLALLTDDVLVSMPPMPFEYQGRAAVARFCGSIFGSGRRFDLVATRGNGQPAFGAYLRGPLVRATEVTSEPVASQSDEPVGALGPASASPNCLRALAGGRMAE